MAKLLKDKGFNLEITPEALAFLAEAGFDPDYGARPLKRTIQREMQNPLAVEVLSGEIKPGDTIRVECVADGLVFIPLSHAGE